MIERLSPKNIVHGCKDPLAREDQFSGTAGNRHPRTYHEETLIQVKEPSVGKKQSPRQHRSTGPPSPADQDVFRRSGKSAPSKDTPTDADSTSEDQGVNAGSRTFGTALFSNRASLATAKSSRGTQLQRKGALSKPDHGLSVGMPNKQQAQITFEQLSHQQLLLQWSQTSSKFH